MEYKWSIYEKKDGIAKTTMNRPEKLNAVLRAMLDEMENQLEDFRSDPNARVWVLTGAGRGFCAGDDLEDMKKFLGGNPGMRMPRKSARIPRLLATIDKPTIAMVNGVAVGMGFEMALACDFMIAADTVKFGESYIQRGALPSSGPWLLTRKIGFKNAIEIALLGEMFDARQAEKYNLTYKVVPPADLEAATMELARKLAKLAPFATQFLKHLMTGSLTWNLETALDFVAYSRELSSRSGETVASIAEFQKQRKK